MERAENKSDVEMDELLDLKEIKAAVLHSWQQSSGDLFNEPPANFAAVLHDLARELHDYLMDQLTIWYMSGAGTKHIETFKEHMISQFTKDEGDINELFHKSHAEILELLQERRVKYLQPFHISMGLCQFLQRLISFLAAKNFGAKEYLS